MIAGLRNALAVPILFDTYQAAVGANRAKTIFVDECVRPQSGMRLLDIGCGTGAVVPFLPTDTEIVGVDVSQPYISAAQRRFGHRADFRLADASDLDADIGEGFDLAYAFGVLHHLPDDLAISLINGAMRRLKQGGRLVTIDPTLTEKQGAISRFIVSADRGKYVRTAGAVSDLFGHLDIDIAVRHDLLRIPFANVIVSASKA
ncbi:class I SAM-dependent methyltransferase [Qipengyuania qiaonensis]|uniref:Class I SAM-dependent methyltransferase n=1 Tax=Qipengyuania qiaonensis TaxID=2867240 RepID=A0ABS7J397_9SPHN|nr:class I SAM-dependent methyltransferase [Qipengyuania qiaonensis]MBX7481746.1 class I SAM-dependent methyltransferase [Qipengyuania qiaonensis]